VPEPCVIAVHLRIRTTDDKREFLLEFLRQARPFYEQPGGIRMRLLQDAEDENIFIEVFEYATIEAYETDEQRVANDPKMKAFLTMWRSLLDGPPKVEVFYDNSELLEPNEGGDSEPVDDDEG
jgi:quinol monooxygenase YgiN